MSRRARRDFLPYTTEDLIENAAGKTKTFTAFVVEESKNGRSWKMVPHDDIPTSRKSAVEFAKESREEEVHHARRTWQQENFSGEYEQVFIESTDSLEHALEKTRLAHEKVTKSGEGVRPFKEPKYPQYRAREVKITIEFEDL